MQNLAFTTHCSCCLAYYTKRSSTEWEASTIRVEGEEGRAEGKQRTYRSIQACETGGPGFLLIQTSIDFLQRVRKSLKSLQEKGCTAMLMKDSSLLKRNQISYKIFNYFLSGCHIFKM